MATDLLRIEYEPLDELLKLRDDGNPKKHSDEVIDESLARFGFVQPLLVDDASNVVGAGHGRLGRLEAWRVGGKEPPARIDVRDGRWFVPVVRGVSFKNATERRRYAVVDNRAVELGGWDDALLGEWLKDFGGDLAGTGFDGDDLGKLLNATDTARGGKADPDAVPTDPQTRTSRGDLWLLGDHRLLCGDSTSKEDVARLCGQERAVLMATDPPYGVDYTATKSGMAVSGLGDAQERWGDIANDALDPAQLRAFLDSCLAAAPLAPRAATYVWHPPGDLNEVFRAAMRAAGMVVHRQIIWAKPGFVLTRSGMYHWAHETCFYGWKEGSQPPWYGPKNQTSVWQVGRDSGAAVHPTQKPVELFEIPMRNHTRRGAVCYEPFSGSGSQIIAGERLERRVFAMELSPRWCDAAVQRWEDFTGKKATKQPA